MSMADVLFDAVRSIRQYQEDGFGGGPSPTGPEVESVVVAMDELRAWMDYCDDGASMDAFLNAPAKRYLRGLVNPPGTIREVLAGLRADEDAYERVGAFDALLNAASAMRDEEFDRFVVRLGDSELGDRLAAARGKMKK